MNLRNLCKFVLVGAAISGGMACAPGVGSEIQARQAYQGLDKAIEKALTLGFIGFKAATSANIPPQSDTGDLSGTMSVAGQVDQGASANKEMRLRVTLEGYSDGDVELPEHPPVAIAYQTELAGEAAPAELDVSLRDIPDGTFTGTLKGTFQMLGDLTGEVTLDLDMTGELEDDGTGAPRRASGMTKVTGTATSGFGVYEVNLIR